MFVEKARGGEGRERLGACLHQLHSPFLSLADAQVDQLTPHCIISSCIPPGGQPKDTAEPTKKKEPESAAKWNVNLQVIFFCLLAVLSRNVLVPVPTRKLWLACLERGLAAVVHTHTHPRTHAPAHTRARSPTHSLTRSHCAMLQMMAPHLGRKRAADVAAKASALRAKAKARTSATGSTVTKTVVKKGAAVSLLSGHYHEGRVPCALCEHHASADHPAATRPPLATPHRNARSTATCCQG